MKLYEAKEAEFPEPEQLRELERVVLLKCHRQQVDGSHRRYGTCSVRVSACMAYGQRDPVVEYKMNAFEMFNNMISFHSGRYCTYAVSCSCRAEDRA